MLALYQKRVPFDWVDYNNHMNDAYYTVAFSQAGDKLIEYLGMDETYRKATGLSIFTVEMHLCYLAEAKLNDLIKVKLQLLGFDKKRLHLFMVLYNEEEERLATQEGMYLHVDTTGPKVITFQEPIQQNIQALWQKHASLESPKEAGRAIQTLANSF